MEHFGTAVFSRAVSFREYSSAERRGIIKIVAQFQKQCKIPLHIIRNFHEALPKTGDITQKIREKNKYYQIINKKIVYFAIIRQF